MRDRKQNFLILACGFVVSCGEIQNKTEPCNCFTLAEYKKLNAESQKDIPAYNLHATLVKIDRNWLVGSWLYIPPNRAFQLGKNFRCEGDAYETFDKNGDILDGEIGEKFGSWAFSQGKLRRTYPEVDEKGNETSKMKTTISSVGKVTDRIVIMIDDDGSLEAHVKC